MNDEQEELLREKLEPHRRDVEANQFLDTIAQIESSGGRDTSHPEMHSGIHAGESAIGQYGLMPNTIRELDPALRELSQEDIQNYIINNQGSEQDLAKKLALKVLSRQNDDQEAAAYAWNQGHNLSPEQVGERNGLLSPYVEKFKRFRDLQTKLGLK